MGGRPGAGATAMLEVVVEILIAGGAPVSASHTLLHSVESYLGLAWKPCLGQPKRLVAASAYHGAYPG